MLSDAIASSFGRKNEALFEHINDTGMAFTDGGQQATICPWCHLPTKTTLKPCRPRPVCLCLPLSTSTRTFDAPRENLSRSLVSGRVARVLLLQTRRHSLARMGAVRENEAAVRADHFLARNRWRALHFSLGPVYRRDETFIYSFYKTQLFSFKNCSSCSIRTVVRPPIVQQTETVPGTWHARTVFDHICSLNTLET
jgi:hypothetical protein